MHKRSLLFIIFLFIFILGCDEKTKKEMLDAFTKDLTQRMSREIKEIRELKGVSIVRVDPVEEKNIAKQKGIYFEFQF